MTLADFQMQRVVLALVLREYPILLTLPVLANLVLPDPRSLVGCVTLARAVRNLAREGLLLSNGLFVLAEQTCDSRQPPVGGEVNGFPPSRTALRDESAQRPQAG